MRAPSEIRNETEPYRASHRDLNGAAPPWVRQLREAGIDAFSELGFPTTRLEDWKYTSVAPIASGRFRRATPPGMDGSMREAVGGGRIGAAVEVVLVNGRYAPELSSRRALPAGVLVTGLGEAIAGHGDLVEAHLARISNLREESFTALNAAFLEDGAIVYVPRGAVVETPVHILSVTVPTAEPMMSCPRILIVAEANARVEVVESHVGVGEPSSFTNAVTEIEVGPGASVGHTKIQRESERAFHVARIEACQRADSRFTSCSISLGGALVRNDIRTVLDAEGGECRLDGLYMTRGSQHVDHHTTIDHRKPRCSSRELYKGVLDGRSTGVFNGKVYVRLDAQKSDAQQVNKNLLLSETATINTKPELQIFADDVRCSHGAAIGRLDENALFYLRSRGIDEEEARELLIHAFSNELIERIPLVSLRERLGLLIASRPHEIPAPEGAV